MHDDLGLIERRGESLDVGLERLLQSARTTAGLDVRDICALLLQVPDMELPDDRALLAVRFPADRTPVTDREPGADLRPGAARRWS